MLNDPILSLYDKVKPKFDWNSDLPIGQNFKRIFTDAIYDLQYPDLITTYSLLSARISQCLPILVLVGKEGTGKSTALDIICKIRNIDKPFACGQSSYPALRQYVEKSRYTIDLETKEVCFEEGGIVLLDNFHTKHVDIGSELYNFLLTGYDRKTSKVALGLTTKTSTEFDTFCPKVISTVDKIHQNDALSELKRRLVHIVFYRHGELFLSVTKKYDLSQVHNYYFDFWTESRYLEYVKLKREIEDGVNAKTIIIDSDILRNKFELFLDLITTSIITGLFEDIQSAVDYYAIYCEEELSTEDILVELIIYFLNTLPNPNYMSMKDIKDYFDRLKVTGFIDNDITFKDIKFILINRFNFQINRHGLYK